MTEPSLLSAAPRSLRSLFLELKELHVGLQQRSSGFIRWRLIHLCNISTNHRTKHPVAWLFSFYGAPWGSWRDSCWNTSSSLAPSELCYHESISTNFPRPFRSPVSFSCQSTRLKLSHDPKSNVRGKRLYKRLSNNSYSACLFSDSLCCSWFSDCRQSVKTHSVL